MNTAILIAVMALVTILTRFLPFLLLRKETPPYIAYLGRVLPAAIIGMLVIYCLKDINLGSAPFAVPELIASLIVIALQVWKRNAVISVLSGTVAYMLLVQVVF